MKIFISGQKSFGRAVAEMLHNDHEIVGVCCPINTGRDPLNIWALENDVDWLDESLLVPRNIPECDLIVCAHNYIFISTLVREMPRLGAISYHPSLLPRHRGRDAVRWTIKMNDPIAGGTVHWLDDGIDTGPIARQDWCWVEPGMTASELWSKELFPMGLRLIESVVRDLEAGHINLLRSRDIPQNEAVATFEPAMNPPRMLRS